MKNILLVGILLLYVAPSVAQINENIFRNKWEFGVKAGLNYANVYNTNTEVFSTNPRFGLVAGGVIRIPITPDIGVQPEMIISQKGFQGTGTLLGTAYSFSRTSTYLDIPLQISLQPTDFLSIVIGPQYSYLLRQKDVFTSSLTSFLQEEIFKNDNIRKNILGAIVGIDLYQNNLVIGARIGWNLINNKANSTTNTPTYRNTWIQGTIGYAFYSKK